MEDKRRALPPASSSAGTGIQAGEPAQSRRRPGGQKRKLNVLSASNTLSTPSKRVTREKNLNSHSSIHNGPLTRARQSPNILAYAASGVKFEERPILTAEAALADDERRKASEAESKALEAALEAEFEAIKSRDANSHVVPSHCGWFSWKKINVLEECAMPTFFNNKSETQTPDVYLEIRNWILKKFHSNPNVLIESKDLSELEVGDLDSRQKVLEFLDYWGLINFHPFPQDVAVASTNDDRTAKIDSFPDKIYCFEAIQPCPPMVPKPKLPNIRTPAMPFGVFPTSAIAEELVRPEGPAVELPEYHCNSCSADCSQKRYHCQTQADYDLCTDCFNSGKFGSDMSSSDFILMVPAEAPGVSGGKWTDQETLLLLEALELYKENWNEIADHVATKTKAQCILHFVQMPIEETFLDSDEDIIASSKETADPAASTNDSSVSKDDKETDKGKSRASEDQPSPMEETKPEDACEAKACQETSKTENLSNMKVGEQASASAGTGEVKAAHKTGENIALKALREAFGAVGYFPMPGRPLSFAEVGNPVMALVVFLARLVGSDVANASARSSLKSVSSNSPGLQLATRHCFVLDDPPVDKNEPGASESAVTDMVDRQTSKVNEEQINTQKEENSTSGLSDRDFCFKKDEKMENSIPKEQKSLISENLKPAEKLLAEKQSFSCEVVPGNIDEPRNSKLAKDPTLKIMKESDDLASKAEFPPSCVKGHEEETALGEHSQPSEVKNVEMLSDMLSLEKDIHGHLATSGSVGEPFLPAETLKDVDKASDSLPPENNERQLVISSSVMELSQPTEVTKDVDMVSKYLLSEKNGQQSVPSDPAGEPSLPLEAQKDVDMISDSLSLEKNEYLHPEASNSVIKNGTNAGEDQIKDSKMDRHGCTETKDMQDIDKLKRAAASAISAAAVKAEVLAEQEEEEIRQLVASMIENYIIWKPSWLSLVRWIA
ncbi:SWI/SNF complex subunit SWI3D-like isoform X2 [Tripterygium wilfordii]|uniref:SWI/SNF complex subunit SWI3D-like isoform X2 n=1 Tax=Tripterygium wilfordii TaxID=458696 RepID=UPI0018F7E56B|nr:SWI/SNF complex subunit SWI3D-like isoform X2 [Tripterygium wilfordii]